MFKTNTLKSHNSLLVFLHFWGLVVGVLAQNYKVFEYARVCIVLFGFELRALAVAHQHGRHGWEGAAKVSLLVRPRPFDALEIGLIGVLASIPQPLVLNYLSVCSVQ